MGRLKFTIRDMLWFMAALGLACGWAMEYRASRLVHQAVGEMRKHKSGSCGAIGTYGEFYVEVKATRDWDNLTGKNWLDETRYPERRRSPN
jgi:hypothetical protein